jgi:hypothetical protein
MGSNELLVLCLFFYFLPILFAADRNHSKIAAIAALNIVAGWTIVGWVVALVWAFTEKNEGNRRGLLHVLDSIIDGYNARKSPAGPWGQRGPGGHLPPGRIPPTDNLSR